MPLEAHFSSNTSIWSAETVADLTCSAAQCPRCSSSNKHLKSDTPEDKLQGGISSSHQVNLHTSTYQHRSSRWLGRQEGNRPTEVDRRKTPSRHSQTSTRRWQQPEGDLRTRRRQGDKTTTTRLQIALTASLTFPSGPSSQLVALDGGKERKTSDGGQTSAYGSWSPAKNRYSVGLCSTNAVLAVIHTAKKSRHL